MFTNYAATEDDPWEEAPAFEELSDSCEDLLFRSNWSCSGLNSYVRLPLPHVKGMSFTCEQRREGLFFVGRRNRKAGSIGKVCGVDTFDAASLGIKYVHGSSGLTFVNKAGLGPNGWDKLSGAVMAEDFLGVEGLEAELHATGYLLPTEKKEVGMLAYELQHDDIDITLGNKDIEGVKLSVRGHWLRRHQKKNKWAAKVMLTHATNWYHLYAHLRLPQQTARAKLCLALWNHRLAGNNGSSIQQEKEKMDQSNSGKTSYYQLVAGCQLASDLEEGSVEQEKLALSLAAHIQRRSAATVDDGSDVDGYRTYRLTLFSQGYGSCASVGARYYESITDRFSLAAEVTWAKQSYQAEDRKPNQGSLHENDEDESNQHAPMEYHWETIPRLTVGASFKFGENRTRGAVLKARLSSTGKLGFSYYNPTFVRSLLGHPLKFRFVGEVDCADYLSFQALAQARQARDIPSSPLTATSTSSTWYEAYRSRFKFGVLLGWGEA